VNAGEPLGVVICTGRPGRICGHCGRSRYGNMPCKRRTCPSYAPLWGHDWRIVMLENLIAYAGKATMYTVTPPGAGPLPWDRSRCGHGVETACSGMAGCVIEADARRRWNESFPKRLSRIYETAQAATRRETGQRANVLAIWQRGLEARSDPRPFRSWLRNSQRATGCTRVSPTFGTTVAPDAIRVRARQRKVREAEARTGSRRVLVQLLRRRPRR
jgi:hypothetical protein